MVQANLAHLQLVELLTMSQGVPETPVFQLVLQYLGVLPALSPPVVLVIQGVHLPRLYLVFQSYLVLRVGPKSYEY